MVKPLGTAHARELGRASGAARRAKRDAGTTWAAEVQATLPPLLDIAACKVRLELIALWTAQGHLSGTAAHALARLHEIWLKAETEGQAQRVKDTLERRLSELETELRKRDRPSWLPET